MTELPTGERKSRRVFISYSAADRWAAQEIAEALQEAQLDVFYDSWELGVGDSISKKIEQDLSSSDILLLLLSQSALSSSWVHDELSAALVIKQIGDRAISIIPVLIEDCEIPPVLADRTFLDLREDFSASVQRLVLQLSNAPLIDYSKLDWRQFESLVADLLKNLGFDVRDKVASDFLGEIDLVASFRDRDPFGAEQAETWLVDIKLYREKRVSVATLQRLLGVLMASGADKKGLIVTNGRLTSVARNFLMESSDKTGHQIRVIDGVELTNLLLMYPELVRSHFLTTVGNE